MQSMSGTLRNVLSKNLQGASSMIPSDLKKDIRTTIRLSTIVKEQLQARLKMSVQEAFDAFINANLSFEILPNKGQNNGEKKMAKKAVKKEAKNVKEKSGKKKATKQSGASKSKK
jgi:hypothetical protein